jgi:Tfp pilus assembly protein PilO
LYGLKRPLVDYRSLSGERTALSATVDDGDARMRAIGELQREVERLEQDLSGGPRNAMTVKQFQGHMVARLDESSVRHGIQLVGVRPGSSRKVLMFEELPFDIEVRGEYERVFEWLCAVTDELKPIHVKHFDIQPNATFDSVQMKLAMVSYRIAPEGF